MKRLGVLQLPPLDGMLVHRKVPPPPAFRQASLTIHQYLFTLLGGERNGESKVLCPRTNTLTQLSLKPRPLDAKSSALAIMPPRLAYLQTDQKKHIPYQRYCTQPLVHLWWWALVAILIAKEQIQSLENWPSINTNWLTSKVTKMHTNTFNCH